MIDSAASRHVLIQFERYERPEKCIKKFIPTLFPCIFYIKIKSNCLRKLKNKNIIKKQKHASLYASNLFFGQIDPTIGRGVSGITKPST